ncbi:MAG: DUF503 domain-containing protein [Bacillota bacterium]
MTRTVDLLNQNRMPIGHHEERRFSGIMEPARDQGDDTVLIGTCTITVRLHATQSLKDKRSVIKGLTTRLRQQLNLSVAEVDALDEVGRAVVGLAAVSLSESVIRNLFRSAEEMAERAPGAEVIDVSVELH